MAFESLPDLARQALFSSFQVSLPHAAAPGTGKSCRAPQPGAVLSAESRSDARPHRHPWSVTAGRSPGSSAEAPAAPH